ncbi:MAG: hypothetical protein HOH43_04335 [Candidatus Latescibacteria bacterium]|nr:hypothetical protein [Candidatus Latescibacterota bacterium]
MCLGLSRLATAQSDPVEVKHADSWRGTGVDDVFHLEGNVSIIHGETVLSSDYVRYRKVDGELALDGHVVIVRSGTIMSADHVVYLEADRQAIARGSVVIVDEQQGLTLKGEQGHYFQKEEYAIMTGSPQLLRSAEGQDLAISGKRLSYYFAGPDSARRAVITDSVTVHDRFEKIRVTCDRVDYTREPEEALITGNPQLVKYQIDSEKQVVVTGNQMVYRMTDKLADVYDSVVVTRGDLRATCDTLHYTAEWAHLAGDPQLREGNNEVGGEDIRLTLADDSVTEAVVTGNARALYAPVLSLEESSSLNVPRSTIEGRTLTIQFQEESVREIRATQNATSVYNSAGEASSDGPPGSNSVRASEITISIVDGQLINVSARGAVTGIYTTPAEAGTLP